VVKWIDHQIPEAAHYQPDGGGTHESIQRWPQSGVALWDRQQPPVDGRNERRQTGQTDEAGDDVGDNQPEVLVRVHGLGSGLDGPHLDHPPRAWMFPAGMSNQSPSSQHQTAQPSRNNIAHNPKKDKPILG